MACSFAPQQDIFSRPGTTVPSLSYYYQRRPRRRLLTRRWSIRVILRPSSSTRRRPIVRRVLDMHAWPRPTHRKGEKKERTKINTQIVDTSVVPASGYIPRFFFFFFIVFLFYDQIHSTVQANGWLVVLSSVPFIYIYCIYIYIYLYLFISKCYEERLQIYGRQKHQGLDPSLDVVFFFI